ncbi:hypothetical protein BDQ17DRAFT_1340870 [Cyathus striatus]|nr:hypothetical protein BDQ17DRAFT_1340870 [Cyathus striatus]
MAVLNSLLFCLFCVITFAAAVDVQGRVVWNNVCPDITAMGRSRAFLDNGRFNGGVTRDGSFVIPNVIPGTYLLTIDTRDYSFDQVRVDVLDNSSIPEVRPYVVGTPLEPPADVLLPYPIDVHPRHKHDYFVPPETFNFVQMLSNPMMLMMVIGGAMVLVTPYLIKNMDPESLQEFKEQQAKMTGLQNAVASGNFKGVSAIMGEETPPQNAARAPANTKTRGNKKSRR